MNIDEISSVESENNMSDVIRKLKQNSVLTSILLTSKLDHHSIRKWILR